MRNPLPAGLVSGRRLEARVEEFGGALRGGSWPLAERLHVVGGRRRVGVTHVSGDVGEIESPVGVQRGDDRSPTRDRCEAVGFEAGSTCRTLDHLRDDLALDELTRGS